MNIQEQVIALQNKINELQKVLLDHETELWKLKSSPEYNKFDNMEVASVAIESKLEVQAEEDCEGSYNCGNPQYIQQFYVNDMLYEGVLDVEYNRHDKTYYYVENSEFTVRKVEPT